AEVLREEGDRHVAATRAGGLGGAGGVVGGGVGLGRGVATTTGEGESGSGRDRHRAERDARVAKSKHHCFLSVMDWIVWGCRGWFLVWVTRVVRAHGVREEGALTPLRLPIAAARRSCTHA